MVADLANAISQNDSLKKWTFISSYPKTSQVVTIRVYFDSKLGLLCKAIPDCQRFANYEKSKAYTVGSVKRRFFNMNLNILFFDSSSWFFLFLYVINNQTIR